MVKNLYRLKKFMLMKKCRESVFDSLTNAVVVILTANPVVRFLLCWLKLVLG